MSRAAELVDSLRATENRLVLAESCTGGLIAAQLASIPGVSQWWCGSAVTYRESTKIRWLNVSAESIDQLSAVSEQVAREMASGVLKQTPEADLSAAITGHLGPDAPPGQDGLVFIGIATGDHCEVSQHQLQQTGRASRQQEAAELVLFKLTEFIRP
ncbi:MAG: CinA family protein [Rubripirellula sp.]